MPRAPRDPLVPDERPVRRRAAGSAHRGVPRKRLGQHFLTDPRILGRIADALAPAPDETVVEIGPGRGALTQELVARARRVVAIELDRDLAEALRVRHAGDPRLTVIARDVLAAPLAEAAGGPYVLVGNVPYYITTPILFHALASPRPARAVFLVQREVAERIAAEPGTEAYGALSVNVQVVARPELAFRVAAGAFTPPPKVESTVVRLTPLATPMVNDSEEVAFRAFVQAAFGMRRKQMRRIVRALASLDEPDAEALLAELGIASAARPETLAPATFVALFRRLHPRLPAKPAGGRGRVSRGS